MLVLSTLQMGVFLTGLIFYLFFSVGEWDVAAVLFYFGFIFILAHCKYNL